ncbi:MAG: hypothetical protein NT120_00535 [Candidatus Aenigmarchaeota archaeon]|nr:hypothetical protein [Candidatus Aenigmarchaeota archaeon]
MDVVKTLRENNIVPKKEFDQYFLTDEKIINEEIMAASLSKNDVVLEVGAGIGNITEKIGEKAKVIAIEKDYSFRNVLKTVKNANVLLGDALEILESLRTVAEKTGKTEFNKIISNIPYSISQDLLLEFLRHRFDVAVLIVQKEFADKLKEDKLGMLMKECAEVKVIKQVPAGKFYPVAIDSTMVIIKQKKKMDDNFWLFLTEIYKNRNKDTKKIIKNAPAKLAKKKIHQLTFEEVKLLYELGRDKAKS